MLIFEWVELAFEKTEFADHLKERLATYGVTYNIALLKISTIFLMRFTFSEVISNESIAISIGVRYPPMANFSLLVTIYTALLFTKQ